MREKLFKLAKELENSSWDTLIRIGQDIHYLAEYAPSQDVNEFRKILQNFIKENYS